MLHRPEAHEYDPYFSIYINLVPDDVILFLHRQLEEITTFANLAEEQGHQRYAPGKWNVKKVLGHISDSERVMSYWLLSVARGDVTKLPGYNQNIFASSGSFNDLTIAELAADFQASRGATFSLLTTINNAAWLRSGSVVHKEVTARALLYIIAGHTQHHLNMIRVALSSGVV